MSKDTCEEQWALARLDLPTPGKDWQVPALFADRFPLGHIPISFRGFDKSDLEDEVAQLLNWHPVVPGLYSKNHKIIHTQVGDKILPTFPINYYLGNLGQKNMKNEGASYYYTLYFFKKI